MPASARLLRGIDHVAKRFTGEYCTYVDHGSIDGSTPTGMKKIAAMVDAVGVNAHCVIAMQ